MARARAADDNRASRALEARGQSIAERIALGGEANREEMAQFIADSQSAPDGDERVERAYDQIAIANTIKHATLAEGDAMLRDMERRLREGGSAREAAALTFARSAQSAKRKMVADDPIGAGIAYGLNLSADPLDFSAGDPQAIAAQMRLRLVDARTAASHFGAPPQIFRPGETRQIAAILREQPEAVPAIAGGLVAGVPADALPQMLRELGREAPQIAQIGRIVAAGGSQSAALDALRGMAKDETGKKRPDIAASIRGEANRQIAGNSLANLPDDMQAIYGAANSIARARMADAGHDPRDAEAARQIYDEALQDAAGRNFHDRHSYGGFARVQDGWLTSGRALLLPADLRSDGWGELMSAMDEKAMAALGLRSGYTTRDLERAYPVNLPGGIAFSQTDPDNGAPRWLASATGGPLIVSAAALREATRDRAPHLWRQ